MRPMDPLIVEDRLQWLGWVTLLSAAALIAVTVWWLLMPVGPSRDPELVRLRTVLLTNADALVALEVQRFVPPAAGQPLDQYSKALEGNSQQIMWEARIGLGMALLDLRTATDTESTAIATARALAHCARLQALLATTAIDEFNEHTYIETMQDTVTQIEVRLTHRPPLAHYDVPRATVVPTRPATP